MICAVLALYLNSFVGVVQSFLKIPALKAMAPTQTEAPLLEAQVLVLAIFVVLMVRATRRFRVAPTLAGDATSNLEKSKRVA